MTAEQRQAEIHREEEAARRREEEMEDHRRRREARREAEAARRREEEPEEERQVREAVQALEEGDTREAEADREAAHRETQRLRGRMDNMEATMEHMAEQMRLLVRAMQRGRNNENEAGAGAEELPAGPQADASGAERQLREQETRPTGAPTLAAPMVPRGGSENQGDLPDPLAAATKEAAGRLPTMKVMRCDASPLTEEGRKQQLAFWHRAKRWANAHSDRGTERRRRDLVLSAIGDEDMQARVDVRIMLHPEEGVEGLADAMIQQLRGQTNEVNPEDMDHERLVRDKQAEGECLSKALPRLIRNFAAWCLSV